MLSKTIILLLFLCHYVCSQDCIGFAISGAQKIENEGFHRYRLVLWKASTLQRTILCRDVNWLFEIISPDILEVMAHKCSFVLRININEGMFVNPDQIADLVRLKKVIQHFNVLNIVLMHKTFSCLLILTVKSMLKL